MGTGNRKVAIVILNFQNSKDSLACVDSICKQHYRELAGILIVDNGSSDENFNILKSAAQRRDNQFSLIRLRRNYGFARGNNAGIRYARRKWGVDYVFIVNNDTLFTEPDMLQKLLACDESDVAVIGPSIRLKNGYIQREYSTTTEFPCLFYRYLTFLAERMFGITSCEWLQRRWRQKEFMHKVLHGCALLLTPAFFEFYQGLYSKTFLYAEEEILWFQVQKVGLKQCYVLETEIFHLEDQSTILAFGNNNQGVLRYRCQSARHAMIAKLLPYQVLKKLC